MKKLGFIVGFFVLLAGAMHFSANDAQACGGGGCGAYFNAGFSGGGCGGGGCGGPFLPGYGAYFANGAGTHGMMAPGAFGVMRPAWYGPVGRYPKLYFRAPIRRALGLPGFTPVRQFLFGRGAIRRQTRRAAIFGRCSRC